MKKDKKIQKVHISNEDDTKVKIIDEDDKILVDASKDKVEVIDSKDIAKKNYLKGNRGIDISQVNEKIKDIDKDEIESIQVVDEDEIENLPDEESLNTIEREIKDIVFIEFSKLIDTIESDFVDNYVRKRHNFLLSQLDELVTATMVFVSSFESKSGFAIERVAKRVAQIKYGEENVPAIVNPNRIKHNIDPENVVGQIIITDIDIDNGELKGKISEFRGTNVAKGRGKKRKESGVNQESIKTLLTLKEKYKTNDLYVKPVDLAFYDGEAWNILELKAGGDLDSSNAPSNIEKLLNIYTGVNYESTKIYFATLYNKDGEGNTWTGAVKKHMAYPEMFLIGKDLWNKILPEGIPYERFTELYKVALEEIDLNERIKEMIRKAVE